MNISEIFMWNTYSKLRSYNTTENSRDLESYNNSSIDSILENMSDKIDSSSSMYW